MRKVLLCCALLLCAVLCLSGCGGLFDAEYVVETEYEPPTVSMPEREDTRVASLEDLKTALRGMVSLGESRKRISFDPAYSGDVSRDLADACWQVRTQDALCAYCVDNISYDLSRIVNYYEAVVSVRYQKSAAELESVVQLPYVSDSSELLRQTMAQGSGVLVLLCEHSAYSADEMAAFTRSLYWEDPTVAPQEPEVLVDMISGADSQRLYEIHVSYGLDTESFLVRQQAVQRAALFADNDAELLSEPARALFLCRALTDHCRFSEGDGRGSLYAALVEGEADSRGMALACVALCRRAGLSCMLVNGEYRGEEHSWNILKIDDVYYHLDCSVCQQEGLDAGFLLNDEEAWGPYRWDYNTTPNCSGTLTGTALLSPDEDEKTAQKTT